MAKRKTFEEKNKFIHPTRKKVIDTVFGREDTTQRVHGYEGDQTKREIGETWTDANGTTWEQKDGYRATVNKMDDVRKYLQELKECKGTDCETKKYSRVDKKLISKTGMCLSCLQKYEHTLRTDGTYAFYEDYKITCNKLAYAKELKVQYESARNEINNKLEFVHEDGTIEKWEWEVDPVQVKKDLETDIENIAKIIEGFTERKRLLEEKLVELKHPELILT